MKVPVDIDNPGITGELAKDVFMVSFHYAIGMDYLYAIKDNKIWRKKRNPGDGEAGGAWELWGKEGLPFDFNNDRPIPDLQKITGILADGDTVSAIGSGRHIYNYSTGAKIVAPKFPYYWNALWGAPFKGKLILPEDIKAFSYSRRSFVSVGYLEDPLKNTIVASTPAALLPNSKGEKGWSGLTHIYTLSRNGTELYYCDTGLPVGFNYEFDMPYRGRFIAENIASSSSTIFLIGETGRMFTVFREFDVSGHNPMMFNYTYKKVRVRPGRGKKFPAAFQEIVNLPAESWRRQPDILLEGKAVITHHISILTDGQGNAARELRVCGKNQTGEYGYYYKKIRGDSWEFRTTNMRFPEVDVIRQDMEFTLGAGKNIYMTGEIMAGGMRVKANLQDFNLVNTPVRIEAVLPSGRRMKFFLHLVDGWTMLPLRNPGKDGTPKLFWGTVEIPGEFIYSKYDEIRDFAGLFRDCHSEAFWFQVSATTEYVHVMSLKKKHQAVEMVFKCECHAVPDLRFYNEYLAHYDNKDNCLKGITLIPEKDSSRIAEAVAENINLGKLLRAIYRKTLEQALVQTLGAKLILIPEFLLSLLDFFRIEINIQDFPPPDRLFKWGTRLIVKRTHILWAALKDIKSALKKIAARLKDYRMRLDAENRHKLFLYLDGLAATRGLYLDCRDFRGIRGLYADLSSFADGEEFFQIIIDNVRIQVDFHSLLKDIRSISSPGAAPGHNILHNVSLYPVVAAESLPGKGRETYHRIFGKKYAVKGKLTLFIDPPGKHRRQHLFPVRHKQWKGRGGL